MGWVEFVHDHRIKSTKGSSDNIQVNCPLCQRDDEKMKLGLSTVDSKWGCWRSIYHRGIHPKRLIQAFLRCSDEEAALLTQSYFQTLKFKDTPSTKTFTPLLEMPPEFMDFGFDERMEVPFRNFIQQRNLDPDFVIPRFELKYGIFEEYSDRLIFPVNVNHRLYGWTARAIGDNPVRYVASGDEGKGNRPSDFLYGYDDLLGGLVLMVTEGVFDKIAISSAMKVGYDSTNLFGKELMPNQLVQLQEKASLYERVVLALDQKMFHHSVKLVNQYSWYVPNLSAFCPSKKDWNTFTQKELNKELARV